MALTLTYPKGGVLVTGGTGTIGGGIVKQFVKAGVPVVFTYANNAEKAENLARELAGGSGVNVVAQKMDMSDMGSVQAAVERTAAECGDIHSLACGAGPFVSFKEILDIPPEEMEKFVENDALGYYRLFKAVTPFLKKRGGGSITTCSSFAVKRILTFDGISAFSKGAVNALVKYTAGEQAQHKIRCNAVDIGWIDNRTWETAVAQLPPRPAEPDTEMNRMMILVHDMMAMLRMKRPGSPEEAGDLFAFLASDQAAYITGQNIAIDGGMGL
jgi:NAD(P)-dependent dehydrogenase (short-subunit alcohol dehydrogenase family)